MQRANFDDTSSRLISSIEILSLSQFNFKRGVLMLQAFLVMSSTQILN